MPSCHTARTGSYIRVRKHLCGIMPCDEKKGKATGVKTCDKVPAKDRNKMRDQETNWAWFSNFKFTKGYEVKYPGKVCGI